MIEQLLSTLAKECKYKPGDTLLVGVSGGADSLVLLHGLHSLKIPVIAAHLDHGLRAESSADCQFVKQFSEELDIRFVSERSDVRHYAEKLKISVEEAGRELRYQFLFEQAEKLNADAVIVAHTADDQVETVLMHMLRGAGLEGLSGMDYSMVTTWHDRIPLFRPMLNIWREEIEAYCSTFGLQPLFDQSNLDLSFYRNRIRHELIPVLEQYNPGIKTALWKTANTLQADREILGKFVEGHFEEIVEAEYDEGTLFFNRIAFLALRSGNQRRLIRLGIHRLRPDIRDIGFDEVDKVIRFVKEPPRSGEADLFRGLSLRVERNDFMIFPTDRTILEKEAPQLSGEESLPLHIPGSIEISNGWQFRSEQMSVSESLLEEVQGNQDQLTAYIDLGKITTPLKIKHRSPGELFSPLGMGSNSIKVSDFLINEKMPKRQRERWPMVFSGNELIWIPGHRISDKVRITSEAKDVVKLTLEKSTH